jgi:hypothetical protein
LRVSVDTRIAGVEYPHGAVLIAQKLLGEISPPEPKISLFEKIG